MLPSIATWNDYELLDSGKLLKCERWGDVMLVRPEPQALWPRSNQDVWKQADAQFVQDGADGQWEILGKIPSDWSVSWKNLVFGLRLASFKHTGLFPEQASNWAYLREHLKPKQKLLNLFGYTGGATLAGLSAGAEVVHVDASKPAISAAKKNAELSGLAEKPVRWIVEDAMKFVEREARRSHRYDTIVMDPPAFGRGPNKELWKFEEGLLPLLFACKNILEPHGHLLVNAYSLGFSPTVIEQTVRAVFPKASRVESVELVLQETTSRGFLLPAGLTVRVQL